MSAPRGDLWDEAREQITEAVLACPAIAHALAVAEQVRLLADHVAANPANSTDDLWVNSIRRILGDRP